MRELYKSVLAMASVLGLSAGLGVTAADAGLDKLHKQRVEAGRTCMIDHWHYKSSGAWPTKTAAEAAVVKSWNRFTSAEYGAQWGDVRLAAEVSFECGPATGTRGVSWSCNLKARPCRR